MSGELPDEEEKNRRDYLAAMRKNSPLYTAGIQLAAAVVVMFFIGRWLDDKWHTTPWMMLAGIMLGAASGFYQFFKSVNDVTKSEQRNKDSRQ